MRSSPTYGTQCGNKNYLSHFFVKNFVKATVLQNKLLKSWFHEIFFWWERIPVITTVSHCGKTRNSLSPKFFFRQINSLVTYLVKPLLSRNFWQKCVRENSRNFHTVTVWKFKNISATKILREINFWDSRTSKICHFWHFPDSEIWFWLFFAICEGWSLPKN